MANEMEHKQNENVTNSCYYKNKHERPTRKKQPYRI